MFPCRIKHHAHNVSITYTYPEEIVFLVAFDEEKSAHFVFTNTQENVKLKFQFTNGVIFCSVALDNRRLGIINVSSLPNLGMY